MYIKVIKKCLQFVCLHFKNCPHGLSYCHYITAAVDTVAYTAIYTKVNTIDGYAFVSHVHKSPARVANNIFLCRRNELKFLDIAEINWSNQHPVKAVTASNENRLQPVKAGFRLLADSRADVAAFSDSRTDVAEFACSYTSLQKYLISFYLTFAYLVIIAIFSVISVEKKIACTELQVIAENEKGCGFKSQPKAELP